MCKKLLKCLAFVLLFSTGSIMAQSKTITGTVSDETGQPIPGVSVVLKGTSVGVSTDFDGNYSLDIPNDGILIFSSIGFASTEIPTEGKTVINVTLGEDFQALDEVVVTALGIKKEKKALGYAVQDVDSELLNTSANPDVTRALQGKVAGVNITTSGGVGGNSRLEIRGTSSLAGNDNVLWVVDGVPFSNGETDNPEGLFGGISNGGGLLDINPDNIANISVLKGGPAAALYGARGANGVIMITTKDGSGSDGLGINYSGSVQVSEVAYVLDTQNQYGQGVRGEYDPRSSGSWGPRFDGQVREAWNGEMLPYIGEGDKLKKFAKTGVTYNNAIALSNSNDKGNYRVSIGKNRAEGNFRGEVLNRLNYDLRAAYQINPWLKLDTKVSYIKTKGAQRPEIGFYGYTSYLNSTPNNIRLQDLAPGYVIENNRHVEYLYGSSTVLTENPSANNRNPYFIQEQRVNNDERNRFFGYFSANISIMEDLSLMLRYGLDSYRYGRVWGNQYEDQIAVTPDYNTEEKFFEEENFEFLFSYNKDLNEDFTLGATLGGNRLSRYSETLTARSGRLIGEDYFFLAGSLNPDDRTVEETFSEYELQSLYGSAELSYKNYLYLNATTRFDWSSSLPIDANDYNYSSVSLSGILSQMFEMPDWVNYLKVRGSWAEVGKDTSPYFLDSDLTLGSTWFGNTTLNIPEEAISQSIRPEISRVSEFGLEFNLFNNRLRFEGTYYDEQTRNQIDRVPVGQSTGFTQFRQNVGLISNKGVEVLATINPVRTQDFNLDVVLNFSRNVGKIEWLRTPEIGDEETRPYVFYGDNTQSIEVRGYEGEELGDIYGTVYERNENGQIVVDDQGLPIVAAERENLGNIQPDFIGSIGLNTSYKGFYMNALFGMQQGGQIYSLTEASATGSGNALRTLDTGNGNGREDFFVDGVTASGASNTTITSAQAYFGKVSQVDEEFIYDASYMKLRELSIGYNFPADMLEKLGGGLVKSARFAIMGRDLFYLYRDTPGTVPDASAFSTGYGTQAFDHAPIPATRTIGCSLNLNF